ncbi:MULTISPECIES: YbaN family protein [Shewanella]|uniref:YbaN family protein n=1 Tax=Shewanella TaxID=22 RepID=UPI001C65749D|nr:MULTISPECIES: YbaN family protein [Shewanella]QYJ76652.1 YbaN family protein [Shewanella sp. FJAT-52076]QYK06571.1 YbaN family protein [Shewanella zhangzhouensis]
MIKRSVLLVIGLISLVLGVAGVFLPLLPTVPFVLLAAFCFARSSERLHRWLMTHPWFADALNNWEQKKAIRRGLKRKAMVLSSLSFAISIAVVPLLWVKLMLFSLLVALLAFLYSVPELEDTP